MANYRPLIVNDSANQIQELNESNDSLMLKEIVGISQNTDKLNLSTSGDMKIEIGGNESARFQTNSVDFSAASNALSVNLGAASGLASIVNFKEASSNFARWTVKAFNSPTTGAATGEDRRYFEITSGTNADGIVRFGAGGPRPAVVIPSLGNVNTPSSTGETSSSFAYGSELRAYYETQVSCNLSDTTNTNVDAVPLQVGCGAAFWKAGEHQFGPVLEFVKTRIGKFRTNTIHPRTQSSINATAVQTNDVLGQVHGCGTMGDAGVNPKRGATWAMKADETWSTTHQPSFHVFEAYSRYGGTAGMKSILHIGEEDSSSDTTGGLTIRLPEVHAGNGGTASGAQYNLYLNSVGQVVRSGSSITLKENLRDITLEQSKNVLNNLRPVKFDWKANGKTEYGLIAEEVYTVDPLLARLAPDEDGNDTIPVDVDYSKVGVMLINVIKDQQAQITALETRIAALEG